MLLRWLFLLHRWLGIALGLVMLLWCLSGFVMMYKPYPELNEAQQLATLAPLDLGDCCVMPALPANAGYSAADLQRHGTQVLLTLQGGTGGLQQYALDSGDALPALTPERANDVAAHFAQTRELGSFALLDLIHNDQWTVYSAYNAHRPLYKFAADDAAHTQWYVSSRDGSILQHTTREQRVWGYLGAVIHWLYPTLLREHVQLWSQTVIWLTIFGSFLTLTGLYFGLKQYKLRKDGRHSPYRGLSAWHHYAGVFFGILTLTWTFSGLFSMNPWGLLEGEGAGAELAQLRGGTLSVADVDGMLQALQSSSNLPDTTAKVELRPVLGEALLFAVSADGSRTRIDPATLQPLVLPADTLQRAAALLLPGESVQATLMTEPDAYYYSHHEVVQLPVWRVMREDGAGARYYLNPQSGALLRKVDRARRWTRWLFSALHRGDFSVLARSRPVWDLFMWPLLLGVTATCATGFLMGMRRLFSRRRAHRKSDNRTAVVQAGRALG
jgi:hypothetical protein